MASKKYDLGIEEGDVFAGPVSDGRFGAVHVIGITKNGMRKGRDSANLVCTRYIGKAPPSMDDPMLRKVLRQSRFAFGGALKVDNPPAVMIVDTPPPPGFVHVGRFPPTKEEHAIDMMGTYGAGWHVVENVYREWRWEHDREAYKAEVEAQAAARRAPPDAPRTRKKTPRSKLTEADFWELIETVDWAEETESAVEPLIAALAERSTADIRELDELLAEKLYALDGRRFMDHAGDEAGNSDDLFLYARCFVVAKGKAFYESVLRNPARFPHDVDLEALLSVVAEAYLRRTGDDYEETTHYSYETGSNAEAWR